MFRNIKREKELIDREIEFYKKEQLLSVDQEIENYRAASNRRIEGLGQQCAKELGEYEHTYHYALQTKGIEIAKLEAKKETLTEVVEANKKLMEQKDAEIKRLSDTVNLFINKQPSQIIQQLK